MPVLPWLLSAATPPPSEVDANLVTPGVIGFIVTFLLAVVVVLLVIDMSRRMRRVRYREEAIAKLDAEEAAARDAP